MTNFRPGDKVQLYPGDTHKKVAKILHISTWGWEFEILDGTSPDAVERVGDILFISFSNPLRMVKIGR
jgi:hypothetical protein